MIKLDAIFSNKISEWKELEAFLEKIEDNVTKGEIFEQFVYLYLYLKKDYYQIKDLYRRKDIPSDLVAKLKLEKSDYGVDGAFVMEDNSIVAYQVKFRSNRVPPTISELATFWTEAEYADLRYVIANCVNLPRPANKKIESYQILVDIFDDLEDKFWDDLHSLVIGSKIEKIELVPDAHQKRIISNTVKGFRENDRGKIIAACGTGKTLTSLWITEELETKKILFLAPSLGLIKQTLESWTSNTKNKFNYICVCSDQTVVSDQEIDTSDIAISEVDFPVTTDKDNILTFLSQPYDKKIIFSTYNSSSIIADAIEGSDFEFDLVIFDEAHRTAGQGDSEMFSLALHNERINSAKRLFMTATERLVRPWILEKAKQADRTIFSMDDENTYGPIFDRYTFGEAIKDGVISDYKIILTAIDTTEVLEWIENNQLLVTEEKGTEVTLAADNIFKQMVLAKAIKEFSLAKIITFHSSIKRARSFAFGSNNESVSLKDILDLASVSFETEKVFIDSVDGSMPAGMRKQKLRDFENAEFSIITNSKCLTEGIDVPVIDSVYFVDPKNSLIDIVQACGRALRKPRNKKIEKTAYFIVPLLINHEDGPENKYETLMNLIQALKGQDERLADWIDKLNMSVARGGKGPEVDPPIGISLPEKVDLKKFMHDIHLQIAESSYGPRQSILKKGHSRRSDADSFFKPLGDMTYENFKTNVADVTLAKFNSLEEVRSSNEIYINHNNISHTKRLGLIEEADSRKFKLTPLGVDYKEGKARFEELFRSAMLNYNSYSAENLNPYKAFLNILVETGKLNYIEFLYAVYRMPDLGPDSYAETFEIIESLRSDYPNLNLLSNSNREKILSELNERYSLNYSYVEVWGSTTAKNKYMYFRNHLAVFDQLESNNQEIYVIDNMKQELIDLLEINFS